MVPPISFSLVNLSPNLKSGGDGNNSWAPGTDSLKNQHRVAITIKPIISLNRLLIGPHNQFIPTEGPDQNNQRRLREMEIRQNSVHRFKPVRRPDEEIGWTGEGVKLDRVVPRRVNHAIFVRVRSRFQDANRSRSDRDRPSPASRRLVIKSTVSAEMVANSECIL